MNEIHVVPEVQSVCPGLLVIELPRDFWHDWLDLAPPLGCDITLLSRIFLIGNVASELSLKIDFEKVTKSRLPSLGKVHLTRLFKKNSIGFISLGDYKGGYLIVGYENELPEEFLEE